MEKQENPAGLCSGCAGDYEDPDSTAWEEDSEEEEPEQGPDGSKAGSARSELTRFETAGHDGPTTLRYRLLFRR